MTADAEAALSAARSDNVNGNTTPSQACNIDADTEPPITSTSEEGTKPPPQKLPTALSEEDVDVVLDNAALLSLYYDPATDQFKHEMKYKLEKDRDSDTVRSLLNCPGVTQTGGPLSPRLDLFFIDGSREGDYSFKWNGNIPPTSESWDWAAVNTVKIQSRYWASTILHHALNLQKFALFKTSLRAEKVHSRHSKNTPQGSTRSCYNVSSDEAIISWSYDTVNRQTLGILLYRRCTHTEQMLSYLVRCLTYNCALAACPMLLGLAVQDALAFRFGQDLIYYDDQILKIEQRTGYNNFLKAVHQEPSKDDLDAGTETAKTSGLAAQLARDQNNWGGLQTLAQLVIHEIQNAVDDLQDMRPSEFESDLLRMQEHIYVMLPIFAARRAEAATLQSRASIQIQGLFNIIAQREQELSRQLARDNIQLTQATLQLGEATRQIAEDSKRDSTSMKAIAAVTMFFLPGTFAASLFAMPIFRWNASSGTDVVSHRIWVYWAVTIPLTLVTFGCFLLWDHLMNKPRPPHITASNGAAASKHSLSSGKLSTHTSGSDAIQARDPDSPS